MMETVGWSVLVPLAVGALLTGLIQPLGTEWGLFRHYWIVAKLAVTATGTIILLLHMPAVSHLASMVSQGSASKTALGQLPVQDLVHAVGGLTVLITVTALSLYKQWGRTPYGRRRQLEVRVRRQTARHASRRSLLSEGTALRAQLPHEHHGGFMRSLA